MKEVLNIRVEAGRLQKLRDVAKERKKTMTQLVEDWIDRLPVPKMKEDSEAQQPRENPNYIPRLKRVGFAGSHALPFL